MSAKILVIGATGNVGSHLVETLVARGENVRAASRQAQAIAGAEAVHFDLKDPATIAPAFEGVDRAYLLSPTGELDPVKLLRPVIEAAARRKVKVVLQTALGVDADDHIPLRQVELLLQGSGVPFVILRPNWFSDNFANYWSHDIADGMIAGVRDAGAVDVDSEEPQRDSTSASAADTSGKEPPLGASSR